ncbi:MAG: FHA domain-containing protein, partial [Chloroflexia bacterium]
VEVYHGSTSGYREQNFVVPRIPPEPKFPTLSPGQSVRGQVTLTVAEARGVPLSQVELFLDGTSLAQLTSPPFSYSWDTTTVPPGTHTLSARVTDVSGNVGETSVSVEVFPAILVRILQPADGAEVSSPCPVQVQVDSLDPLDRVEYRVDAILVAQSDRADAPTQLDLGSFSAGKHRLHVLAVDRAGRRGEAEASFILKGGTSWYLIAFLGFLGLLLLVAVIVVATRLSRPRPAEVVSTAGPDTIVSPPQVPGFPTVTPGPAFPPEAGIPSPEPFTRPSMPAVAPSDTRVAAPVVGDTIMAARRGREPETELMMAPVAAAAWLVGKEGEVAGHQFPLHKERVILGRSSTCDIVLGDPAVSNRHAAIVREGETFTIQDLASTNGTFVGGERITEPRVLNEGEEIRLGKTVLVFKRL